MTRPAPLRRLLPAALAICSAAVPFTVRADPGRGADVFDTQCAECHSIKAGKNRKGPSLFAVMGRRAGTADGFNYSDAMKSSGIVWTATTVAHYVASPRAVVPQGKMKFDGTLGPSEMSDLISFLESVR